MNNDQYGPGFGLNVNQMQNYGPNADSYGGPMNNYQDGGYNFNYKPQHQGVPMNQVQPDGFKPAYYGNDQFRNLPSDDYQQVPAFNENAFAVPEKQLNKINTGNNKQSAVEDCNNCPELKNCLNITDTDCCPKCEQYGCICQGYQSYDCIDNGYKDKKVPEGESYNVDGGSTVCNCPMGGGQILCSYVDVSVESSNSRAGQQLTIKCMPVARGCYKTLMRYDGCEECLIFGCEMNGVKTKAGDRYQSDECTDCFCPDLGGEFVCRQKESCGQNKEQDSMRNLGYESGYHLHTDPRQASIQYADDPNQPSYDQQVGGNQFVQEINPYDMRFPGKMQPLDDVQNGMTGDKSAQKPDKVNLEQEGFNRNPYGGYGQNNFHPDFQPGVYRNGFENNYAQPMVQDEQNAVDYQNEADVKTESDYFGNSQDNFPLNNKNKLENDEYANPELNAPFPQRNQYLPASNRFQPGNQGRFEQDYNRANPDNGYLRPRENDLYGNPIVQPNIVKLEHNPVEQNNKRGFVELDSTQTQNDNSFTGNLNSVQDNFKEEQPIVQDNKANDKVATVEKLPENIQSPGMMNQQGFQQNPRFAGHNRFPQPYGPFNPYQFNPYMQNAGKKFPEVNGIVPPLSMDNQAAIPPQLNPYLNNFGATPMLPSGNQFANQQEAAPRRQEAAPGRQETSAGEGAKEKFVLPMYNTNKDAGGDKEEALVKENPKLLEDGSSVKTFSDERTQVSKDNYAKDSIAYDSVQHEQPKENNMYYHRRPNKISSQLSLAEKLNLLINKNKIKTEENSGRQNTVAATSKPKATRKTKNLKKIQTTLKATTTAKPTTKRKSTTTRKTTTTTQRPTTTTRKPTTTTKKPTTTQRPTTTTTQMPTTTTQMPTTTTQRPTTTTQIPTTTTKKPTTTTRKPTTTTKKPTTQKTTTTTKPTTTTKKVTTKKGPTTNTEKATTKDDSNVASSSRDQPENPWQDINLLPTSNDFETFDNFKEPTTSTQ